MNRTAPPGPPRRTHARGRVRRERLLEAAVDACRARGLCDLALQDVADAAGLAKSVVLYYFADRPGLLDALAGHVLQPIDSAYDVLAAPAGDPREPLNRWLSQLFELAADPRRPLMLHLALVSGRGAKVPQDRYAEAERRWAHLLAQLLQRGHAQYAWHAPDPHRSATLLRGLTEGMLLQAARGDDAAAVARLHGLCRAAVLDLLVRR